MLKTLLGKFPNSRYETRNTLKLRTELELANVFYRPTAYFSNNFQIYFGK